MTLTQYGPGDEITWGPCVDPRDPRWDGEELLSLEDAEEQARDEIGCTPYSFIWWIQEQGLVEEALQPVATEQVSDYPPEASLAQLVALLMAGTEQQIVAATYELRDRFLAHPHTQSLIRERALEILEEA